MFVVDEGLLSISMLFLMVPPTFALHFESFSALKQEKESIVKRRDVLNTNDITGIVWTGSL